MKIQTSPAYCLPIIESQQKKVLAVIKTSYHKYQYFEVWLDYLSDFDLHFLDKLKQFKHKNIIVLLRRLQLAPVLLPPAQREEILLHLSNSKLILDLDFRAQKRELDFVKKAQIKVATIFSYHNYESTPSSRQLGSLAQAMLEYSRSFWTAPVIKFSCFCQSPRDAVRLLQFGVEMQEKGIEHIVLGMGPHGMSTRIFGTLWGNKMIFAPLRKSRSSAPGQLTRNELMGIFKTLQS